MVPVRPRQQLPAPRAGRHCAQRGRPLWRELARQCAGGSSGVGWLLRWVGRLSCWPDRRFRRVVKDRKAFKRRTTVLRSEPSQPCPLLKWSTVLTEAGGCVLRSRGAGPGHGHAGMQHLHLHVVLRGGGSFRQCAHNVHPGTTWLGCHSGAGRGAGDKGSSGALRSRRLGAARSRWPPDRSLQQRGARRRHRPGPFPFQRSPMPRCRARRRR